MSSKLLIALVVGVILTLAAFRAWPDAELRQSLRVSTPGETQPTVTVDRVLSQPDAERTPGRKASSIERRTVDRAEPESRTQTATPEPTVTLTIHARLVDSSGEPITNGKLFVPEFGAVTHSDTDGRVTIRFNAYESWEIGSSGLYLRAEAPDFATLCTATRLHDDFEVWLGDLVLKHAGRLTGQVLDADGAPVDGAIVIANDDIVRSSAQSQEGAHMHGPARRFIEHDDPESPPFSAVTGPDGRFLIEDFFAEWATVYARKSPSPWAFVSPIAMLEGQANAEVVLTLERPLKRDSLRGQVYDTTGQPLAGVRILANEVAEERRQQFSTKTDADGRFEFSVKFGSTWNLIATPVDWERDIVNLPNISAGATGLIIVLPDTEWLWAHVADEEGVPQTEGQVFGVDPQRYENSGNAYPYSRIISDMWDDGRARLRVTANRLYFAARIPGFHVEVLGPFAPNFDGTLEFTVKRKPMIRGVVTAMGRPNENASISLHAVPKSGTEVYCMWWRGLGAPFTYDVRSRAQSSSECKEGGVFQVEFPKTHGHSEASDNDWIVRAQSPSFASVEQGPYSPAELRELGELRLALTKGGAVRGRLKLPEGEEHSGWSVVAMSDRGEFRQVRVSNEDGTFHFEHLRPGPWQLRAFKPGDKFWPNERVQDKGPRDFDVRVMENQTAHADVDVELVDPVVLRGKLTLADQVSQAWRVRAYNEKNGMETSVSDSEGRFELILNKPGDWILAFSAMNWDAKLFEISDSIKLEPGITTWEHELELGVVTPVLSQATEEEYFTSRSLLHRGSGNLRVIQSLSHRDDGDYKPFLFPVGKAELLDSGLAWNQEPRDPTIVAREYELERGSGLTIQLP